MATNILAGPKWNTLANVTELLVLLIGSILLCGKSKRKQVQWKLCGWRFLIYLFFFKFLLELVSSDEPTNKRNV